MAAGVSGDVMTWSRAVSLSAPCFFLAACAAQSGSANIERSTYYDNVSRDEVDAAVANDLNGVGWEPESLMLEPNADTVRYYSLAGSNTVDDYLVETLADKLYSPALPEARMREFRACFATALKRHMIPDQQSSIISFVTGQRRGTLDEAKRLAGATIASARRLNAEAAAACPQLPAGAFDGVKF